MERKNLEDKITEDHIAILHDLMKEKEAVGEHKELPIDNLEIDLKIIAENLE